MLAGYTGLMVYHALAGKRQTKGVTDYYVGGRSMGGIALCISFFATYSSTNSFVGFSGQAYTYGAPWLLLTVTAVTFSFIAWKWITPRLRDATELLNSVTIPDFIRFRFGSNAARVGAAIIVVVVGSPTSRAAVSFSLISDMDYRTIEDEQGRSKTSTLPDRLESS